MVSEDISRVPRARKTGRFAAIMTETNDNLRIVLGAGSHLETVLASSRPGTEILKGHDVYVRAAQFVVRQATRGGPPTSGLLAERPSHQTELRHVDAGVERHRTAV